MEQDTSHGHLVWLNHPNPLVRWGGRAWLAVGLLLLGWALWHVAGVVRIVLVPLVVALFPAGILMPAVDGLRARGWNRGLASFAVTAGFVVVIVVLIAGLAWQVGQQTSNLADQLAATWESLRASLGDPSWLPRRLDAGSVLTVASESSQGEGASGGAAGSTSGSEAADGGLGSVVFFGRSLMELGAQFFLGIVAVFFYLRDRHVIANFLVALFPSHHQDDAREIARRTWDKVTAYIRGQTIVAVVDGVLFAIGLLLLGVPLAWVLGTIVALGAYVPVVGSIVAGAVGVAVALVTEGLTTGLLALALIVAVQQLEGNVLAPYVLGRQLEVHPLVVLVAVTAGAALLGPFGALIGVPLAASLHQAGSYIREEVA